MTPEEMIQRTKSFSLRAMRLCEALPNKPAAWNISNQLSRSSSSVSANYRAAQRARSKAEFIAKLGIVEEESDESTHWLEMIIESGLMATDQVKPLLAESNEITAIVVSSLRSAKSNRMTKPKQNPKPSTIRHPPSAMSRIGHGFDLHRLEPGRDLIVCGCKLDHDRGCDAHSDGDVVYHAVTDAVLGALGQEDIGQLFPDNDEAWKDADSAVFVREAAKRMADAGSAVGNLDITVILERPKLGPHKDAMKANLADLLNCDISQVNLKAKTHEGVDALGENRAIACHAVVLLTPA